MVSLPAPPAQGLAAALRSHLLEVGFLDGLDEGVQAVGEGLDKDVEEGDDDNEQHVAHCRAQQQPLANRIHLPAAAGAAAQAAAPAARDNVQLATLALSLSLW
jgi:hypothetical protein